MELVIGTKRWSTWSMRPWLVLRHAGIAFTETLVELRQDNDVSGDLIRRHSPSGLVPVLKDGDLVIWDTLAICEYLAERSPGLWPSDPVARALTRAATAEMHSGFRALRMECPMALDVTPVPTVLSADAKADVRRIVTVWNDLLARFSGPFLGGAWSIADAFYTPVATRFETYGVELAEYGDPGPASAYCERLLRGSEYLDWKAGAL